jgi:anti-sigma-K factor RskA
VPPGVDPAHVHQLWLIPPGGKPHSLGMVEPGKTLSMPMPQEMMPMVTAGAQLAVSVEAPGGSTRDEPTGPVAAIGKLSEI